jgi:hypothetical protein
MLAFTTGLHTGELPVRVEVHDHEPGVDPVWQEVEEVPFTPAGPDVVLALWDGVAFPLELEEHDYRVRFSGFGFDNETDGVVDPPERYLVQFWPAPPAPDRVLRQTSEMAAYWHRVAAETPLPSTAAERAEARRRKFAERERRDAEFRRADQERYWGGRIPVDPRLLAIAARAVGLAQLDRDLLDQVADADPAVQRTMAIWAARYTCEQAGLAGQDWVVAGLNALGRGEPSPPWFTDFDTAFAHWRGVPRERITHRVEITIGAERAPLRIDPEVNALHAVIAARDENPLLAAITAVQAVINADPDRPTAAIELFRTAFNLR